MLNRFVARLLIWVSGESSKTFVFRYDELSALFQAKDQL